MYRHLGFTLVELMITLVVAAIFMTAVVPSYRSLIQNNRAVTLSNDFITSISLAKSEAIKRGETVSICASANATQTACGNNTNWPNGWIVFSDPNGDGVLANAADRIRVHQALENGASLATTANRVTFAATGFVTSGAGTYTMSASGCVGSHGRIVTISNTGRTAVADNSC